MNLLAELAINEFNQNEFTKIATSYITNDGYEQWRKKLRTIIFLSIQNTISKLIKNNGRHSSVGGVIFFNPSIDDLKNTIKNSFFFNIL